MNTGARLSRFQPTYGHHEKYKVWFVNNQHNLIMDWNIITTPLLGVALAVSASVLYRICHRKIKKDQSNVVWVIGASSGIGRGI